ncbi:hypothetical protein [Desulfopila sp. IMCC35008]|uniref:hypothetical protein n=1 Tax=Desulfopila sp. IMCC35008 TaxID=2653858 RepID=UPI0013D00A88|nr:hypothetical protein [Desulfopila sp. IMCC35008]
MLLYKIINWWYYSPPGEGDLLCGDSLEYVNTGNAKVHLSGKKTQMKITIDGGFAPLLSVVNKCETCPAVYTAVGFWQDSQYFSGERPHLLIEELPFSNEYALTIEGIDRKMFETVMAWETDLVFTLSGTVQGLQNGKIALGGAEDMLGKCQTVEGEKAHQQTTYFTVSRSVDEPVLMRFEIHSSSG